MKKFLFVCIVFLSLLCLVVPTVAEEPSTPSRDQETTAEVVEAGEHTDNTTVDETPAEVEEKWTIGKFFDDYASTIFTVLSTVGVSVVAYLFKGALLPSMKNGLVALSDISRETHDVSEKTAEKVHDAMTAMNDVTDKISALVEQIKTANGNNAKQQDILYAVLLILKEGFSAAKLPEYTKDRINTAIDKVNRQLEVTANEETV